MSIDELVANLELVRISSENNREREGRKTNSLQQDKMDPTVIQSLLTTAIAQATEQTRQSFQATIDDLTSRLANIENPLQVEEYKPVEIMEGVECNEPLDIVKSLPEFNGDANRYVSWRQAAITAHRLYEGFNGSSKYYQAVAIIRNKVVGAADTVLSSYNTVLNFRAILSRLDFAYGDKRSIFTLEQELSTLKQGSKPITNFYDEVEQKLTLIVNKVAMTNEGNDSLIRALNQKYRDNALRIFISGLRRPVCDILFSCKPPDMPSALALAQELETNQTRYSFATTFWNQSNRMNNTWNSPHYQKMPSGGQLNQPQPHSSTRAPTLGNFNPAMRQTPAPQQRPEPMEVDRSFRSVQRSMQRRMTEQQPQAIKRPWDGSMRQPPKFQRINHLQQQEQQERQYPHFNGQGHE